MAFKEADDSYRFRYGNRRPANPSAAARASGGPSSAKSASGKAAEAAEEKGRKFSFSSDIIEEVLKKSVEGYALKRHENPWFKNLGGVRRPFASFSRTHPELIEYAKCKMSVHYFAENYCKIKREDGTIGSMKLRDYQVGIIDLYTKNSRAILMASRQTGKCIDGESEVLVRFGGEHVEWLTIKKLFSIYMGNLHADSIPKWNGDASRKVAKMVGLVDGELEVESVEGWSKVSELTLTFAMQQVLVVLANGQYISCAHDHLLMTPAGWMPAGELHTSDRVLSATTGGWVCVEEIMARKDYSPLYDLTTETSDYYANNILCHNTVSAAIVLTHYVTFNNDKGVMIVANKASTVIEIVDKIKSIYKLLPYHLKAGVVNWGQRTIVFDNGCRIKTEARTKEPSIGFTIDFLYLDEFAHIPANIITPYYSSVVPTVSSIANSKIIITSTPNGKNLFWSLVAGAEKKKGELGKNPYTAMRVYWYQVPGRLDTKVYFDEELLAQKGLTVDMALSALRCHGHEVYERLEAANDEVRVAWCIKHDSRNVTVDTVSSNLQQMREALVREHHLAELGEVTNWQEQETALLGGSEEAFNQEYNLRFIASAKMLFDAAVDHRISSRKVTFVQKDLPQSVETLANVPLDGLTWHPDFNPMEAKNLKSHYVISIDLAEGLGGDYSVLNVWRVVPKDIEQFGPNGIKEIHEAFCLHQVGMWRSNTMSVKAFAEAFYMLAFMVLDPEQVKVILEWNGPGAEFLAQMPQVMEGRNEYGSFVFVRYKHRADADEKKIGLRVNANKNMLVKEYADQIIKDNLVFGEEGTVAEVTNFVKAQTAGGGVTYKAETGNDDVVMTIVSAASFFATVDWKNITSMLYDDMGPEERVVIDAALRLSEHQEAPNYAAVRGALLEQRSGYLPPRQPMPIRQVPFRNGVRSVLM